MCVALVVTDTPAALTHNATYAVQNQKTTEAQYKNYYKCDFRIPKRMTETHAP